MHTQPATGSEQLVAWVIHDAAKGLADREGETGQQRDIRFEIARDMIDAFQPHGVIEAVLAGQCVMFHAVMTDSVHDTLRGEADETRPGTRNNLVAMGRSFAATLGRLERYQLHRAKEHRHAADPVMADARSEPGGTDRASPVLLDDAGQTPRPVELQPAEPRPVEPRPVEPRPVEPRPVETEATGQTPPPVDAEAGVRGPSQTPAVAADRELSQPAVEAAYGEPSQLLPEANDGEPSQSAVAAADPEPSQLPAEAANHRPSLTAMTQAAGQTPPPPVVPMNRAARRQAARGQKYAPVQQRTVPARMPPAPTPDILAPDILAPDILAPDILAPDIPTPGPTRTDPAPNIPTIRPFYFTQEEKIAACEANPEAMAALHAGDAARFARALGYEPCAEFLAAAAAPESPFGRQEPRPTKPATPTRRD